MKAKFSRGLANHKVDSSTRQKDIIVNTKGSKKVVVAKFHKLALVALALVMVLGSLPNGEAKAWAYGAAIGRRGNVTLPTIYIGDLAVPWGSTQFTLYGQVGPTVYKSPASTGAQIVGAQYFVEKWDGTKWVISAKTGVFTGKIGATQTKYTFPAPYIQPMVARGSFRVTYNFSWSTNTGKGLGGVQVVSNLATDHRCVTPYRLCRTYAGYFRTGGYNTGAW